MTNSYQPDAATKLAMYRKMSLIKHNDDHSRRVVRSGTFKMNYYSPRGQEAIPAAISVSLNDDDYICTIYRGIHDMLAKGLPLKDLWAEQAGKVEGTCKGKGGPMHITYPAKGIMVTTGIVGASAPIANGLAWASLLSGTQQVTIANFGDGASNIGAFHEALNMASVWKLPVVFVCQNNRYAEHTAYRKCTAVDQVSTRAGSYTMPGVTVDGNDPVAMYSVAKEAIERARAGEGPTLIEAMTYRFHGHHMGDNQHYMPIEEREAAMAKDPLILYRQRLISEGVASEDELLAIDAAYDKEVLAAIDYSLKDCTTPDAVELRRDVYAHEVMA